MRTSRRRYTKKGRKAASFRRRRTYRRRFHRSGISPLQPIARKQIVRMRYDGLASINSPGAFGSYFFRANSIYDPDLTGTGHQPLPHDLWQSLYNHYQVLGSKISVIAYAEDSATNYVAEVGINVTDDTTVNALYTSTLKEQPGCTSRLLRIRPDGCNSMVRLRKGFSAKKWFGVNRSAISAMESTSALFGANPTEGAFFHIWCAHPDDSTDIPNVNLRVRIDYIVEVTEPKEYSQS